MFLNHNCYHHLPLAEYFSMALNGQSERHAQPSFSLSYQFLSNPMSLALPIIEILAQLLLVCDRMLGTTAFHVDLECPICVSVGGPPVQGHFRVIYDCSKDSSSCSMRDKFKSLPIFSAPISVFQHGEDLVDLSRWLGGPVSDMVQQIYAKPQVLPVENDLNSHEESADPVITALTYTVKLSSSFADRRTRPNFVFCLFGGSEKYFYRVYDSIIELSGAVWFLIRPVMNCRSHPADVWEEESHARRIALVLSPQQPLMISLVCIDDRHYEVAMEALHIADILAIKPGLIRASRCNPETGDGVRESVEWLVGHMSPPAPASSPPVLTCTLA